MNVFWNSLQIFVFVSKNALCVWSRLILYFRFRQKQLNWPPNTDTGTNGTSYIFFNRWFHLKCCLSYICSIFFLSTQMFAFHQLASCETLDWHVTEAKHDQCLLHLEGREIDHQKNQGLWSLGEWVCKKRLRKVGLIWIFSSFQKVEIIQLELFPSSLSQFFELKKQII